MPMQRRSRRVIIAFAVSPLAASMTSAVWVFALGQFFGGFHNGFGVGVNAAIMFVMLLLAAYLAAAVLGVPGYLLFRRIGWVRRRHWFLLGTVIGYAAIGQILAVGILASAQVRDQWEYGALGSVVLGAPLALVMALVFTWLIRRTGPDIDRIAATFD
jgi:hypothetical protein